ncbi:hypothetical protein Plim_0845 [Planctopirus limnophila DSM 3776]|uniref:Uncharacterized protein n=1 Tax=Planctopirus limnophila (strain ATCC 43296 / DSM 3776 / IFAM 1008 / Mu 290) TaxID=521674 RepID=D5SSE1_PLAL2|nr:hypothetical protein Plim_0845 [Planctopirus limnophila DSM 3776]
MRVSSHVLGKQSTSGFIAACTESSQPRQPLSYRETVTIVTKKKVTHVILNHTGHFEDHH